MSDIRILVKYDTWYGYQHVLFSIYYMIWYIETTFPFNPFIDKKKHVGYLYVPEVNVCGFILYFYFNCFHVLLSLVFHPCKFKLYSLCNINIFIISKAQLICSQYSYECFYSILIMAYLCIYNWQNITQRHDISK